MPALSGICSSQRMQSCRRFKSGESEDAAPPTEIGGTVLAHLDRRYGCPKMRTGDVAGTFGPSITPSPRVEAGPQQ